MEKEFTFENKKDKVIGNKAVEMKKEINEEVKRWEKAFETKMTTQERRMFIWGVVYGVEKSLRKLRRNNQRK